MNMNVIVHESKFEFKKYGAQGSINMWGGEKKIIKIRYVEVI